MRVEVSFVYVVKVSDDDRGPYRCSTRGYIFSISDRDDAELMSYHWHPLSVSPDLGPHMHIGKKLFPQDATLHVPTERVTVEDLVEQLITSFGVAAAVDEDIWRPLIRESKALHITHHTSHIAHRDWHGRDDAPTEFPEQTRS